MLNMYLGENLSTLRRLWGESQEVFGRRFGIGRSAVGKWEAGESEPPVSALVNLEEWTGVPFIKWVTVRLTADNFPTYPILADESNHVVKEPADDGGTKKGGDAELLEALKLLRMALDSEKELAAAERAENARFRKEFEFLKKKVELLDAEVLRTAGKKK